MRRSQGTEAIIRSNSGGFSYLAVGESQRNSGKLAEALKNFEAGRAVFDNLVRTSPSVSRHHFGLGKSYYDIGLVHEQSGQPADRQPRLAPVKGDLDRALPAHGAQDGRSSSRRERNA